MCYSGDTSRCCWKHVPVYMCVFVCVPRAQVCFFFYLAAAGVAAGPVPAASVHCAACSPTHCLWSERNHPAVGSPACTSATAEWQRPGESTPSPLTKQTTDTGLQYRMFSNPVTYQFTIRCGSFKRVELPNQQNISHLHDRADKTVQAWSEERSC